MSGKSNTWQTDLLKLVFQNIAAANIGDATGLRPSSTTGSLYIALHTADPTNAGNQSSSETSYTGYARVAIPRTNTDWTVSGTSPASVSPAANIDFGLCTVGTPTITYFSVGCGSSGATEMLYSGTVTPNIVVAPGVIPRLTTATAVTEA